MDDLPPIVLGSGGLLGRPQLVRGTDLVEPDADGVWPESQPSRSLPPNCLRVLSTPLAVGHGGGCDGSCPGKQPDGGCLVDLVRAANAAGIDWQFEVRADEYGNQHWTYVGLPVDATPPAFPGTARFECPHCRALRASTPCEHCGR